MNHSSVFNLIRYSVKIDFAEDELNEIGLLLSQIDDWEYFAKIIIERGLAPLFYKKLTKLSNVSLIPVKQQKLLQQTYFKTLSRSMILYDTFNKVAVKLNDNGIKVIVLKGIYLAEHLYKDIGLRQFSDIDLLIPKADGQKAFDLLIDSGFKPFEINVSKFITGHSEIVHLPPLALNGVSVELHLKLHRQSKHYNLPIQEIIDRAIPVKVNGISVFKLDQYDLLIHLCVHLDKHFTKANVQFISFSDIVNILNQTDDNFIWSEFINRSREAKAERVVFKYLVMSSFFFFVPLPEDIFEKYKDFLKEQDKELFIMYLKGEKPIIFNTDIHLQNIRLSKNLFVKARYFFEIVFPSRKFMLKAYPVNNPLFYWLWYPYRLWIGLKGVLKGLKIR